MKDTKRARFAALFFAMTAAAITVVPAAAGAKGDVDGHCAATQIGVADSGEIIVGAQRCFATLDQARAFLELDSTLGYATYGYDVTTFYDPSYFGGYSFSVSYACGSGYLNFGNFGYPTGGTWNNRVSALITSCSYIALYTYSNLGGSRMQINGAGNVGGTYMNNAATSAGIAYA